MRELIREFREWQREWDAYHNQMVKNPDHFRHMGSQPSSVDTFIEKLEKKYKVTKK